MQQLIMVIHVLACVAIVVLVLLQHGKGADIGAAFGGGASNTVFGSQGSGSFLLKLTGGLAAVFFITSLSLGYISTSSQKHQGLSEIILPETNTQQTDSILENIQQESEKSDKLDPNDG